MMGGVLIERRRRAARALAAAAQAVEVDPTLLRGPFGRGRQHGSAVALRQAAWAGAVLGGGAGPTQIAALCAVDRSSVAHAVSAAKARPDLLKRAQTAAREAAA